jgi:predicted Na+-dependent transporter
MLTLKLLAALMISSYMLAVGLTTTTEALSSTLHKKSELARAVVIMLVLGPLTARLITAVFGLDRPAAAAIVLLSLTGVVPLASRGAGRAGGDTCFAVVLTATLGFASAITAVPTTRLLIGYGGPLEVPAARLFGSILLLQVAPLVVGMLLRARSAQRDRLERILTKLNAILYGAIAVAAFLLMLRYGAVRSLGWSGVAAAILFAAFISAAGYFLLGGGMAERRSLAGIANMPNFGLALVMVFSAHVGPPFAVAIVGVFVVRLFVGLAIQSVLTRSARGEPAPAGGPNGPSLQPTSPIHRTAGRP